MKTLLATLLALSLLHSSASAADPLLLHRLDPEFQRFIGKLRWSVRKHDTRFIYDHLAPDFYVRSDSRGLSDPAAGSVENFNRTFGLDSARGPGATERGWTELALRIGGDSFEEKPDGEICAPYGAREAEPFPEPQLCFRKITGRGWVVSGHIDGGE